MELLQCIEQQIAGTPLPLFAVTVAAVPCPDTPVILTLHWHGFIYEKLAPLEDAPTVAYTPVPSSALQVNARWRDLVELDRAAMDAGWELGAWDVARAERPSCTRPGAEYVEALECLQAFAVYPWGIRGQEVVVADTPDAEELLTLARRRGYLLWTFRPVHRSIWEDVAEDDTLRPDGTREPPCPVEQIVPTCDRRRRTVYRFGRSNRLLS